MGMQELRDIDPGARRAARQRQGYPSTAGLLAHVLVVKYGNHLPLYRQERIFERAGLAIAQSTLGAWVGVCGVRWQPLVDALREQILRQDVLHADETPVQMLSPGKGKTHRGYLWAWATTQYSPLKAVVYEFTDSRAGEHAHAFLGDWQGKLVCDDFKGYVAAQDMLRTVNRSRRSRRFSGFART